VGRPAPYCLPYLADACDEPLLLDHLIRPLQERRRNRQAEGLGRLEVDDKVELRRLQDGDIGGFMPLRVLSIREANSALNWAAAAP
jgi:hypothetical protein